MALKTVLQQRQLEWAKGTGLEVDSRGYLPDIEFNLFQPLSVEERGLEERGQVYLSLNDQTRSRFTHSTSLRNG